ncbi:MAG TPA: EscU/YscU/HrcU family type III secretion system export apparatus switch protein [Polyangia bacterium]|jgi:flagellar biosynthesis protein FlhB|nr:EscU/YscU/HrcU family type III secretion system export apparatus switch protein [Polyangia bacterium]
MAGEPAEDRTESPSARRSNEARGKGQIPIGKEINAVAGFAAGTLALMSVGPALRDSLIRLVASAGEGLSTTTPVMSQLQPMLARPLGLALSACAAAGGAGVAVYLFQTKGEIWLERALPDIGRVFTLGGGKIGRLFSKQLWADMGISVVKLVTVGWAVWSSMRDEFMTLPTLLLARSDVQFAHLFGPLCASAVKVLTVLAIWAGVDIAITRWRYAKEMKMTKAEAKRDAKEDEGDTSTRGRRRRKLRELIRNIARAEVPRADALVVNPTHIAIAIRYRASEDKAPRVTAKGKGEIAEMMRELARENGIPIVENIPLARLLYKRVKVGRSVPAETYKAVAAILAYVYRITHRQPAAAGAR